MSKYRIQKVVKSNQKGSEYTTYYIQRRFLGIWWYVRSIDFAKIGYVNYENAVGQLKFYEMVGRPRKTDRRDWKVIKKTNIYVF